MLKSMTGFGKSVIEIENKKYIIEIRSLNSKLPDVNIKIPVFLRNKELSVRNQISKALERGKIDMVINFEANGTSNNFVINKDVVENYHKQLLMLNDKLNINSSGNLLEIIMRMPDTMKIEETEISESEWKTIENSVDKALAELNDHRENEGKALETDITGRVRLILEMAESTDVIEEARIKNIRGRLKQNLMEHFENNEYDINRFEQEMIFYLEKIDITEEKVRLKNHCMYFLEIVNNEQSQGKKLGFICQEIGREINTLGSKANDSDLQKIVINMKDELEKIKEQLLNIL
jgi:uncharacterized protein (TIGR00255 family)